nr:PREDICTED: serine/threonine-protein phosphatase 2A activator-like isoform X1 [Bemisia tabaci]
MDQVPKHEVSATSLGGDCTYEIPKKCIFSEKDMKSWELSEAYDDYFGFIKAMNEASKAKSLKIDCEISEMTRGILNLLSTLDEWIDQTPPIEQPQRFGNKAFALWYQKCKENSSKLLEDILPKELHPAIVELKEYLTESFGNSTRIDYGTGHEMSFCMFLCCLFKLRIFQEKDSVAVVTRVFNKYLNLVRKLQKTYRMEPAGSHGVWSLDDYQFVPFIWGSAQFIGKPIIEPSMFLQDEIVNKLHQEYMFIGCIKYITEVKTGHFAEHSNQLWNISGLTTWTKVNQGLIKMYDGEVLRKFPVIQHVLFGSILRFQACEKAKFALPMQRKPSAPFSVSTLQLTREAVLSRSQSDADASNKEPGNNPPVSVNEARISKSPDNQIN